MAQQWMLIGQLGDFPGCPEQVSSENLYLCDFTGVRVRTPLPPLDPRMYLVLTPPHPLLQTTPLMVAYGPSLSFSISLVTLNRAWKYQTGRPRQTISMLLLLEKQLDQFPHPISFYLVNYLK